MMFLVNPLALLALSLSAVISTVSGALYTDLSQLPFDTDYDFIIVGGEWIFPVYKDFNNIGIPKLGRRVASWLIV